MTNQKDTAEPTGTETAASIFLAHVAWILGGFAVAWSAAIWVGLTNFTPTSFAVFKDLNYSATVVHGLWVLGLLLAALHFVLHLYRRHDPNGERFPGRLGPLVIPPPLRWLRILLFLGIAAVPTAAQVFMCGRMFAALVIVHNGGSMADTDTKQGIELLTDFGTTDRPEGNSIFRGWHWHSWNDDRGVFASQRGIDAWPAVQPILFVAGTFVLVCSLLYLTLASARIFRAIRTFFRRLLILTILVIVAWYFLAQSKSVVDRDSVIARIQTLRTMLEKSENKHIPESWDAGIFVPNDAINKCLSAITGKTLVLTGIVPDTGIKGEIEMTVRSAAIDSSEGTGLGHANLEFSLPAISSSVKLDATLWFAIKGIIPDPLDPNVQRIVPSVRICEVTPSASLGDLFVQLRGKTSQLVTSPLLQQINAKIEKTLADGIPLPVPKDLRIEHRSHQDVSAGQAKLGLEFTVSETLVPIPLKMDTSMITKQGIWLLLAEPASSDPITNDPQLGAATDDELNKILKECETEWATAQKPIKGGESQVLLWVNQSFFSTMAKTVARIPPQNRKLVIQSQGYTGHLYEKRWRDKILGSGGVELDLNSPDALTVTLEADNPELAWSDQNGLVVSVPLHCVATGSIHVHVDPLIGGGAGTSVGMRGESSPKINFAIGLKKMVFDDVNEKSSEQIDAAVLAITNFTPSIEVSASTDGKFVLDWGWTKVPPVRIKVTQALPDQVTAPIVLCDDRPLPSLDLSLKEDSPITWKETGRTLFLAPRLGDFSIETSAEGMMIGAVPHLEATTNRLSAEDWQRRRENLQAASVAQWEAGNGKMKMGDTSIAVLVGDIEFGPNNDLVVFLRSLGKDAEEMGKILKDAGEEISPEKIRGWIENPGDSIARSDAGKVAKKVESEAKAAAEKTALAAKETAERVAAEAKRVAEDARKAAEGAKNWVGKRLGVRW